MTSARELRYCPVLTHTPCTSKIHWCMYGARSLCTSAQISADSSGLMPCQARHESVSGQTRSFRWTLSQPRCEQSRVRNNARTLDSRQTMFRAAPSQNHAFQNVITKTERDCHLALRPLRCHLLFCCFGQTQREQAHSRFKIGRFRHLPFFTSRIVNQTSISYHPVPPILPSWIAAT